MPASTVVEPLWVLSPLSVVFQFRLCESTSTKIEIGTLEVLPTLKVTSSLEDVKVSVRELPSPALKVVGTVNVRADLTLFHQ